MTRFIVFCAALLISASSLASTFELIPDKSSLGFVAKSGGLKVNGNFKRFKAVASMDKDLFSSATLSVTIDTSSVDTGIKARDKHLRGEDFFWTQKYPEAIFVLSKATKEGDNKVRVEGQLTLRGVTKVIQFNAKLESNKDANGHRVYRAQGSLTLNRQDFGLSYKPFFLLPSIQDQVEVVFDLTGRES